MILFGLVVNFAIAFVETYLSWLRETLTFIETREAQRSQESMELLS